MILKEKLSNPIFKICFYKVVYLFGLGILSIPFYNHLYGNIEKKGCMNGYFYGLIFAVVLAFIISIMFLSYLSKNNSIIKLNKLIYLFYIIPITIVVGFFLLFFIF